MANEGARKALESYFNRLTRKKRKNGKPEDAVNDQIEAWFTMRNFSMVRVESKATYSQAAGRYTRNETASGTSDWMGCTPIGLGAFIETKAPGKRHTLKEHQRDFLISKILRGAFAACVDSLDCLESLWNEFKISDRETGRKLLLQHLPAVPKKRKLDKKPDGVPF